MRDTSLAVPVKLWAVLCATAGVSLTADIPLTCALAVLAFCRLAAERRWKLVLSFGGVYLLLAALLYLIRFHGLHMAIFSEFYVLMFYRLMPVFLATWDLISTPPGQISAALSKFRTPTPVILGVLVVFRFFPTMKAELRAVRQSMKNRRLTGVLQFLRHPAASCEYVLVPLLLRCLQVADQLSASAVARGAETPGVRGSYYARALRPADLLWAAVWTVGTAAFLTIGGVR